MKTSLTHNNTFTRFLAASLALALFPLAAPADDVTDQVNEAMQAYKDKDYAMAAQGLDIAAQLIRQKRGEGLTGLLPEPIEGWTADEASSQAAGSAIYGGGVSASRSYHKGDETVTIQYLTDSPILQSMSMMLNMPGMAGASGMKIERLKGQKAMVNAEDHQISIVVAGAMLVQIEGDDVDLDVLRQFAGAIDYNALANSL